MTNPVTPPPELVQEWTSYANEEDGMDVWSRFATWSAQWGADQELEACCKVLEVSDRNAREFLYAARRPKPPSLKKQALAALGRYMTGETILTNESVDTIRRALEELPDN